MSVHRRIVVYVVRHVVIMVLHLVSVVIHLGVVVVAICIQIWIIQLVVPLTWLILDLLGRLNLLVWMDLVLGDRVSILIELLRQLIWYVPLWSICDFVSWCIWIMASFSEIIFPILVASAVHACFIFNIAVVIAKVRVAAETCELAFLIWLFGTHFILKFMKIWKINNYKAYFQEFGKK